jgi:hypothetical protein
LNSVDAKINQDRSILLPKIKIKTEDGSIRSTEVINPNIHVRLIKDSKNNLSSFAKNYS